MFGSRGLRLTVAALGVSAATTVGIAVAAAADGTDEADLDRAERAARLCKRVPRVQERLDQLLERLQADSETRGSVAWPTAQAEQARTKGHDDLAMFLEHRATIRIERIDVLNARADALDDAASWCADRQQSEPTPSFGGFAR
jgi:hypothetical protein